MGHHQAIIYRKPWLRFFRAFSSVVRQMPGYNWQRRGTARTSQLVNCVALCIVCVDCVVLCIVCVYMCTVLLPPGVNPVAVNIYIYKILVPIVQKRQIFGIPFTVINKIRVKVILVQALRVCSGRTAHRGSRGIALLFLDHGTRRGWGVSVTPRPLFTPGKGPVPIVQEVGWAPGPDWTGAENLARSGIRCPDRPARSQSLYRLSYRAYTVISSLYNYYQLLKAPKLVANST